MTLDEFAAKYGVASNAPAAAQVTPWSQAALGGPAELGGSISGALSGNPIGGTLGRLSALGTKAGVGSLPGVNQIVDAGVGQDYNTLSPQGLPEQLLYHGTNIGSTIAQLTPAQAKLATMLPGLQARTLSNTVMRGGILGGLYGGAKGAVDSGVGQTLDALGRNNGLGLSAPTSMIPQMALDAVKEAIPTAAQFATFEAGGLLGAKLGAKAAPLKMGEGLVKKFGIKTAQNIHEASARAGASIAGALTGFGTALLAGAPQEEQVAQALLGGGLGLITPSGTQRIVKKSAPASIIIIGVPDDISPNKKVPLSIEGPSQQVWDRINAKTEQLYQYQKEQRTALEIEKYIRLRLRDKNLNEDLVMDATPIQQARDYLRLADHHATIGDPVMAENYIGLANKIVDDLVNSNRSILLYAKNPGPADIAAKKIVNTKGPVGFEKMRELASYLELKVGRHPDEFGNVIYMLDDGGSVSNYSKAELMNTLRQKYAERESKAVAYKTLGKEEQMALEGVRREKDKDLKSKIENLTLDNELKRQAREKAVQEVLMESWNEKVGGVDQSVIQSLSAEQLLAQAGQTPAQIQLASNPELAMRVQKLGWDPVMLNRMMNDYKTIPLDEMVAAAEQVSGLGPVPKDAKGTLDLFRVFESLDGKIGGFMDKWFLKPLQHARVQIVEETAKTITSFSDELKALGFKVRNPLLVGGKAYSKAEADMFGKYLNGEITEAQMKPHEVAKYQKLRDVYRKYTDDIFNTMKPILKELGYGDLTYRENYFAWYREDNTLGSFFSQEHQDPGQANRRAKAQEVPYRHMMRKGDEPVNLVDPFRALELVVQDAARLKAYEPLVQRAKFLADQGKSIERMDVHNLFDDLAQGMIGARTKSAFDWFFSEHKVGRGIMTLTDNFVGNVLSTFNPVLNQIFGLPAISAELGVNPATTTGAFFKEAAHEFWGVFARKALDPNSMSNYLRYSQFARARELGNHNSLSQRPNLAEHAFSGLYRYFDRVVGATAWQMGYDRATRQMKMTHEDAVRYGDLIASRTQGVFDTLLKPKLLQGPLGRVLAPLSTGTFAAFNTIMPDVIQNKSLSPQAKAKRVGYQIGMTMAVQLALAGFYGGSRDPVKYLEDSIIAQIPVLGGMVRSGMSGPVGTLGRFIDSPTPTSLARTASMLSPVRGSYQALKTFEGVKALMNSGQVFDRNGELSYEFDTSSLPNIIRALTFSPSKTKEGRERYAYLDTSVTYKIAKGLDDFLTEMGINPE